MKFQFETSKHGNVRKNLYVFTELEVAIVTFSCSVGVVPVTGETLPFINYGGSSLLVSMLSIGIILNISKNN